MSQLLFRPKIKICVAEPNSTIPLRVNTMLSNAKFVIVSANIVTSVANALTTKIKQRWVSWNIWLIYQDHDFDK